ncbi:cytochrome P450, partial [Streptomyces sp. TRM76130]|nr:cytochrome P450 [Streptomyces sp. TRM76130]
AEDELRWRSSIASRHLLELPVRFEPKPPQDVTQAPSHAPVPPQRAPWHIGAPLPRQVGGSDTPPAVTRPAPPADGQPAPGASAPPVEPARPLGAWQRLVRWWSGY